MEAPPDDSLPPFKLERFFNKYEFKAKHLLCCSDCEALTLAELLELADADSKRRWDSLKLTYTDAQGLPALREAVAKLYTRVSPDDMVVVAPEEGIYLTMRAVLQPGDHVVCMFPGYQSLHAVAISIGCQVSLWEPALAEGGRVVFEASRLQELLRPAGGTKLVVTNFPHNPTGAAADGKLWGDIEAALQAAGSPYLFSDEMYRFLDKEAESALPSRVDTYDRAIVLCGVSKSWGLPGLRIGWVACKDPTVIRRVCELKDYTTICSPGPSEVLALMAVRATEKLTRQHCACIWRNVAACEAFFSSRWGRLFDYVPPAAGPLAFPRLKTGEPIDAWCEALVQEAGVLLLPASVYDWAPGTAAGHFRLGLGRADLDACLAALDAWLLQRYPGQVADAAAAAGGT